MLSRKVFKIIKKPQCIQKLTNKKDLLFLSHQKCSVRKGVLRNFAKFARKDLFQSLF